MRKLLTPPKQLVTVGGPAYGSFAGSLPELDFEPLGLSGWERRTRRKRWSYACVADEAIELCLAVVDLGYAATALVFAFDRRSGSPLLDHSELALPSEVRIDDRGAGARGAELRTKRLRARVSDRGLDIDLQLPDAPPVFAELKFGPPLAPPISALVPVAAPGRASATEKRMVTARGEITLAGRRYLLSGAQAGLDHTHGILARDTAWQWALGMGKVLDDIPFGFNVVEGFVGEAECAYWLGDQVFALGEARFRYRLDAPEQPWRLETTCGALSLDFQSQLVHREMKNFALIRSHFLQIGGSFAGTLRHGGRSIALGGLAGVVEHQDVRW